MSVYDNYQCEGQMSLFDLDIWSGKMSPERSAQTKERTLESYLKKFAELRIKPPLYLCLQNGARAVASWETVGALRGEYMMHSFGESPRDAVESRLSQILTENPHPKYSLSAKACQGILNRAERRGKELPEQLRIALIKQSLFKSEQVNQGGGKGILIQNERTGALSTQNNQAVCAINANATSTQPTVITPCAYDGTQISPTLTAHNANGSQRMPDKENFNAVIAFDRAAYNQGQNAQYDFSVEEELAQTIVAKGPGGGMHEKVGALCARGYKGVGTQYVNEGKVIIQSL